MSRLFALALLATSVVGQDTTFGKWCGKYYQIGAPYPGSRPAGSLFPYPESSSQELLDFRCVTASSLYISGDDANDPPMILVDANITYDVGSAYHGAKSGNLDVEVYIDGGKMLTSGQVKVDSMGTLLPFNDGQQEFWFRVPYGTEGEAVTSMLAWNHGAQGHASWNSQYSSQDLLNNASFVADQLYGQSRFLLGAYDSRQEIFTNLSYPGINGYDVSSWTIKNSNDTGKDEVLVFAVNQNYGPNDGGPSWVGIFELANYTGTVKEVLFGNVTKMKDGSPLFFMPRTSVAGVILEK